MNNQSRKSVNVQVGPLAMILIFLGCLFFWKAILAIGIAVIGTVVLFKFLPALKGLLAGFQRVQLSDSKDIAIRR